MTLSYQLIKEKKLKLKFPSELFINGNYQKSISEKLFDNIKCPPPRLRKRPNPPKVPKLL